jgi:hypothetical protein
MLDTQITDRDVYFKDPTSTDSPQPLKNMWGTWCMLVAA